MKEFLVISNNCASSYFYRSIKKRFNHPFVWSVITERDILKLLIKWRQINWNNIKLFREPKTDYPIVSVDNIFSAKYVHYRLNPQDKKPRIAVKANGTTDVFYCDNIAYTKEKYKSRIKRMPRVKPSLLLMHWGNLWECSNEVLYKIIKECQKRSLKILIITFRQKGKLEIKESRSIKWIDIDHEIAPERVNSDIIAHSEIIKGFFEK